jgi:PHD/YefM family antitoxin component YafN of YafNO toxin-antitoxin module
MISVHPEFVVDKDKRTKAVILPVSEWNELMNDIEELEDIRAYDKAKAESQESIPFLQAVREIGEDYDT